MRYERERSERWEGGRSPPWGTKWLVSKEFFISSVLRRPITTQRTHLFILPSSLRSSARSSYPSSSQNVKARDTIDAAGGIDEVNRVRQQLEAKEEKAKLKARSLKEKMDAEMQRKRDQD